MDFDKIIKKRASIREYSSKKPPVEQVIECIDASNSAPSPGNLQILKYIIVENSETIKKIAEFSDQDFIQKAQILVIVCSNNENTSRMYDEHEKYIKQHAGAAIENFLLKITDLELASCWVGSFSQENIKDLLKIPANMEIQAILPVGYGKKKQEPKPPLDSRIYFEKWNNKYRKPIRKIRRDII